MKVGRATYFFLIVGFALTFGEVLMKFGARLWSQEHYQFFPIFLIGVVCLVVDRARNESEVPRNKVRIGPISFGLFLFALLTTIGFRSPMMGYCSVVLLGYSLLCGYPLARRAWSLLAILIPPPLGFDTELVHTLQRWSSIGASRVLDRLHVPHVMEGNIVQLADRRLFVEEACSGLGSIYLIVGATLFWLVYTRERLIRGFLLCMAAVWWSIASNVIRIVAIAVAHEWGGVDLATGAAHQVLGVLTMLLALGGTAGSASLIRFLLSSISDNHLKEDKTIALTPVALWNIITTTNRNLIYRTKTPIVKIDVSPRRFAIGLAGILILAGAAYWSRGPIAALTDSFRSRIPQLTDATSELSDTVAVEKAES